MLFYDDEGTQIINSLDDLHTLWRHQGAQYAGALCLSDALHMLVERFDVGCAVMTWRGQDGTLFKVCCGKNPLEIHHTDVLAACVGAGHGVYATPCHAASDGAAPG